MYVMTSDTGYVGVGMCPHHACHMRLIAVAGAAYCADRRSWEFRRIPNVVGIRSLRVFGPRPMAGFASFLLQLLMRGFFKGIAQLFVAGLASVGSHVLRIRGLQPAAEEHGQCQGGACLVPRNCHVLRPAMLLTCTLDT